jgi:HEPN domain-containing protein
MTKEQKFKKEYAFELLKIAEGDLETTKVLLSASTGRKENVCFNAQQVIEKSLKAVLCFLELPVPFTHNLDILIDRLPKSVALSDSNNINELTEYATIRRYEEGTFELDSEDLKKAYVLAEITLKWAQKTCTNS